MGKSTNEFLHVDQSNNLTIVKIGVPQLTHDEEIDVLADFLYDYGSSGGDQSLLLNFELVTLIGTATWGILIRLNKMMTKAGGALALCGFGPNVKETVEALCLDQVFRIYDDQQEALKHFPLKLST